MGFASHRTWAEGYAAVSAHHIAVTVCGGDRLKWRAMCGGIEFLASVAHEDEIVVVDGMLDLCPLAAELRLREDPPVIVMFMHENQLTTPFSSKDRDARAGTSWLYGAAHWRSLQTADFVLFNSSTHLAQFAEALP